MFENKIYDVENKMKNKLIVSEIYNKNIESEYPKIMSYYPTYQNDLYVIKISDTRLQNINNINLTLTLPEIKGKGIVAYKKYYIYHLIKSFDIFYVNKNSNDKILFNSFDSEELLMNILCNPYNKNYLNYCSGKNDEYCTEKEGYYNDCVIFPKRTIVISLENIIRNIKFYPDCEMIFEIKINNIKDIIYYNIQFESESLKILEETFKNSNINLKLDFTNNIITNDEDEKNKMYQFEQGFIRRKKAIGQHGSDIMKSDTFKNCIAMSFYNKCKHFNDNNKFISVMGNETNEKKIINNWIKKILKDLIIVTDLDLTDNKNKKQLGFKEECIFEEVINNKIKIDDNSVCNVYIELIPDDYKIYFHKNILCFSRRYNKNNLLNISNLFKTIKGIIYSDNISNIIFNMDQIQHNITIDIVSVPVNIWSHIDNTSTKDLRSENSKKNDFIYNNIFINGTDFLSKDKGFNKISVIAGKDNIENYNIYCKHSHQTINILKTIELDKNFYPNIAIVDFCNGNNKRLESNKNINFENILVPINWKQYQDYEFKSLYTFEPHLIIYEGMVVKYIDNEIIINPL